MGWIDDMLGDIFGTSSKANTTTNSTTPTVPADVEAARKLLMAKATAFANEPYPEYKDSRGNAIPRLAQFTPDQLRAFSNVRDIASTADTLGSLTPGLTTDAINATTSLAKTLPNVDLSGYMNPYLEDVLEPAIRDMGERAARERLKLGQQSARTGSFGGSRQAIAESELERSTMRNVGELSAKQRAEAYNSALDQFRKDQTNIPALYKGALDNLSTGIKQNTDLLATMYNPLLASGTIQQGLNQAGLDVIRREFEEQRDYPLRGMDALRGALGLSSSNLGIGNVGTSTPPSPNLMGQILGTVAAAPKIAEGASTIWNWGSNLFS